MNRIQKLKSQDGFLIFIPPYAQRRQRLWLGYGLMSFILLFGSIGFASSLSSTKALNAIYHSWKIHVFQVAPWWQTLGVCFFIFVVPWYEVFASAYNRVKITIKDKSLNVIDYPVPRYRFKKLSLINAKEHLIDIRIEEPFSLFSPMPVDDCVYAVSAIFANGKRKIFAKELSKEDALEIRKELISRLGLLGKSDPLPVKEFDFLLFKKILKIVFLTLIFGGIVWWGQYQIRHFMARNSQTAIGLEWSEYLGKMKHSEAIAICTNQGKRLPTTNELKALFQSELDWTNRGCKGICEYWSSEFTKGKESAYLISMIRGDITAEDVEWLHAVRCVR